MATLLLAEANTDYREALARELTGRGHDVSAFEDAAGMLKPRTAPPADAIVLDVALTRASELDLLSHLRSVEPDAEVIVLVSRDDLELAHDSLRKHGSQYLVKPISPEDVALEV